jgi:hypothetical protein
MAEKIISPGVFTNEIDQSFLPSAVADIGAALIGPTLKGPALIPTVVTSYSDFQNKFGDVVKSGSNSYQFLTSHAAEQYLRHSNTLTVVRIMDGAFGAAEAIISCSGIPVNENTLHPGSAISTSSIELETLADGTIMNNETAGEKTNNILTAGSKANIRYEISNRNFTKGTFTLAIRAGNDNQKRKQTLETFTNLTLDPNSPQFISKVIGDQTFRLATDSAGEPYLQLTGSYPNKSRFVRVRSTQTTLDYLDENGNVRDVTITSSLPAEGSGSMNGGFKNGADGLTGFNALGTQGGSVTAAVTFYDAIGATTQGFTLSSGADGTNAYTNALNLLKNQDEFDINLILAPGIIANTHTAIASKIIDVCEDRGDCFAVLDPVPFGSQVSVATTQAETRDSNFAAMYWPWIKIPDSQIVGTQRWVPPSVAIGGIYAFNDKVAHPWFAPAGLNRGGIDIATQAERKLTQNDRDTLYDSNVNPIATFPGQGVTVFGQKTLQKKASALDRINVRRLLIRVKKFIASSSRFLLFEQNNSRTRSRFLNIVNPFLEQVQSQSGLTAFRVVMDGTNNTPDVIDRNQLVGQLFLQPTRTAEFIVLDFTVQPTGATFPE